MEKNAYHIITDTHFDYTDKENRISYVNECLYVKRKIVERVNYTNSLGYNSYVLFLGDIYSKGYRSVEAALAEFDFFTYLDKITKGIFTVYGNHEQSFPSGNPFYNLISNIPNDVTNLPHNRIKLLGITGLLEIRDRLVDGNVVFNFNHYGSRVLEPLPDKINIGLFHQNITCGPAVASAGLRGLDQYETKSIKLEEHDVLFGYDYSFMGHFHKYYGKWMIDGKRYLYYLGSLNRPNYTEVSDDYLERTIPCVYVENGELTNVEDYKFNLMSEKECLKFDVIEKQKEKREKRKELMNIINLDICTEDLIDNVKLKFNSEIYNHIIDSVLLDVKDNFMEEIERRF